MRPFDLALALVLAALAVVETVGDGDAYSTPFNLARAALGAGTMLTLAARRSGPASWPWGSRWG